MLGRSKPPILFDNFELTLPDGRMAHIRIKSNKKARRLSMRVATKPFLHIAITKPPRYPEQYVVQFLEQQKHWIMAHLPFEQAIADGTQLLYRGAYHRIKLMPIETRSQVIIQGNDIMVFADKAIIAEKVRRFFKQQAKEILTPRINHYAGLLEKDVTKITVCDYQSQWGRCSSKGEITINWRLIMAPDAVSDYVAAHEAAHLVEMNHSSAFWDVVDGLIPERKTAQKWLRKHGLDLQTL